MTMRRWMAALALAVVVAGGMPAAAAEPQVTDPCGPTGLAAEPTAGATTPWTDICSAAFTTLDAGSALQVTATFAGDIPDDRIGLYAVAWRVGDCTYRASHEAGTGEFSANGVIISDLGGDRVRVRCGESVPGDCSPPIGTCPHWPDERHFDLTDAVTVAGDSVTWTLRFTDDLADIAGRFTPGTQLTNLYVESSTKAVLAATNPSFCYGTTCGAVGGDVARGAGYTIGD